MSETSAADKHVLTLRDVELELCHFFDFPPACLTTTSGYSVRCMETAW